jgi:hypothetical protein
MKRLGGLLALAAFALLPGAIVDAQAAPRRDASLEAQLRQHIAVLASDDFEGREPGTEGESKTLRYLAGQWIGMGLVSGTNEPGKDWFAPVKLIGRDPAASFAQFMRKGRRLEVPAETVLMLTSSKRAFVSDAPVVFVGRDGGPPPGRNELAGRVVLLLDGGQDDSERQNKLLEAGAAGVLTILDGERTLESVAAHRQRTAYALASEAIGGDLEGFISPAGVERLTAGSGETLETLIAEATRPDFMPRVMNFTATLEATTRETTIRTHNLIGKIPGRRPATGAVLYIAHWDAFGRCVEPPAEDQICNGAIDNASGVAALTEIARRLAMRPQIDRDIYFLATTAEELGLLGAHAFAENPPLPLNKIVAAFNIDSVAIAPAGTPFAIVGKGQTPLDADILKVARQERRKIVDGDAANAYVRRQDGWALLQHDIPAVLVSSAYGDIKRMEAFFEGDYHRPGDGADKPLELGGAAEDVTFLVALGRWFGDPKRVPSRETAAKPQ